MKPVKKNHFSSLLILSSVLLGGIEMIDNRSVMAFSLKTTDPIQFNVVIENQTIGAVEISESIGFPNQIAGALVTEGLRGLFEVSLDSSGLSQLKQKYGISHFNWFQILKDTNYPGTDLRGKPLPSSYIDPPKQGAGNLGGDDVPWFWYEKQPSRGRELAPSEYLQGQTSSTDQSPLQLNFIDAPGGPGGRYAEFDTFLIADFGNKTYDILGSFSWRYEQKIVEGEGFFDTNNNGVLDDGEAFQDSNGDRTLNTYSDITALSAGTGFTTAYANKIKREFGYTQDQKLFSYVFDGQLSAGKFNTFTKSNIPKSTPFIAWTDNQIKPNLPSKPDTLLGSFDSSGKQVKSKNNNGGPYQPNLASGIRDFVNPDGKIVLKVTGNPDGNFKGCKGGSGGSGCSRPAHQESGKYKTYVKLYETRLPTSLPKASSSKASDRVAANNAAESANSASGVSIERTPEASPVLGLLVLGLGGYVFPKLKNRNNKPKQ